MRKVVCAMGLSIDGYTAGPDGGFAFSAPDEELFAFVLEEFRNVGAHLMGRKLYETMLYWETEHDDHGPDERTWGELWRPLPKVVFSRTLDAVEGNARLATGTVADEVARLRSSGKGDIAIGGPTLAHQAADLVDEYQLRVHPALVGGGTPFFPRDRESARLELVEQRAFPSGVVFLRYTVLR